MDSNEARTLPEEPPTKTGTSELFEAGVLSLWDRSSGNNCDSNNAVLNNSESVTNKQIDVEKDLEKQDVKENIFSSSGNDSKGLAEVDVGNSGAVETKVTAQQKSSVNDGLPFLPDSTNCRANDINLSTSNEEFSKVIVKTSKPLCADYHSNSESESVDSESDSSTTSVESSTGASSDSEGESDGSCGSGTVKGRTAKGEKKLKGDLSLTDLPPIENLKISVPEDACVEIGRITSIVETLVIVESYKGTSALDIDTVLFLDFGRHTLGKVFDILGPVSEPVYAVRFNSYEQIKNLNIKKDMKVYYAPKTEHTTFIFMSEVLKNRGSDASWKDNAEAPPEFQDFSDDEEERLHRNKQGREFDRENPSQKEQNKSRKRPFNKVKPPSRVLQGGRFRNPDFSQQRPHFPRNPSAYHFVGQSLLPRPAFPDPGHAPPFPCPPGHPPPHLALPHGPPFGGLPFLQPQGFQQAFHHHRTPPFPQGFGGWGRPMFRPPPPPPPPGQSDGP